MQNVRDAKKTLTLMKGLLTLISIINIMIIINIIFINIILIMNVVILGNHYDHLLHLIGQNAGQKSVDQLHFPFFILHLPLSIFYFALSISFKVMIFHCLYAVLCIIYTEKYYCFLLCIEYFFQYLNKRNHFNKIEIFKIEIVKCLNVYNYKCNCQLNVFLSFDQN